MDTPGVAPAAAASRTKKTMSQRDAQRAQENRARKSAARFRSLARRYQLATNWTAWMRGPYLALRRLQDLLWREWTRPHLQCMPGSKMRVKPALGLLSRRDEYVYLRALRFCRRVPGSLDLMLAATLPPDPPARRSLTFCSKLRDVFWREWTRPQFTASVDWAKPLGLCSHRDGYIHERAKVLAPLLMQHDLIADTSNRSATEAVAMDDSATRIPGSQARTRTLTDAEIPRTPASAKARKKRGKPRRS